MKVLHTSDLHIGKKIMGRERYAEYRAVFSEIAEICRTENVELALIAGDVFDTYTPSAEAEEIFYSGVKQVAKNCAVLIISGNHDDYVRLTAAASIAEELNVYIVGNNLSAVDCKKRGEVYPESSGAGWVIFKNGRGESVYVNTLPYPNEARFKEGKSDEPFLEKAARWIAVGESGKTENIPSVFLSHIFVAGGIVSDSEREIDLGGARAVPYEMLPKCDYCALGHLHRRQRIGGNAYYCGAPMQFSFDESGTEKSVNVFDLTESGVENFRQIPINGTRKLIRLQAVSVGDGLKLLDKNAEFFVELTLILSEPLTSDEISNLHSNENLVSLKVETPDRPQKERISNREKSSSELFSEFYMSRYGTEIPNELLSLFLSLTEEE